MVTAFEGIMSNKHYEWRLQKLQKSKLYELTLSQVMFAKQPLEYSYAKVHFNTATIYTSAKQSFSTGILTRAQYLLMEKRCTCFFAWNGDISI